MGALTREDLPRLREAWLEKYADILGGVPERLPPFREINHRIPLIDEGKVYKYHLPRCPDSLKPKLIEKINRYERAQWWVHTNVPQAMPMMCLPKRDGGLRTVFDCRQRNDNTIHDVSPFPDQEQIRQDVARAPFRSKIDLSDAYEQIRVVDEDVWKTAFSTVYGTMESNVMQQGDCNAPSTFQRLMVYIFRNHLGKFVHVYLDDVFIFSMSIEEHEEHLGIVFETLRKAELYLKAAKVMLYAPSMDCLGHVIDDDGLHADSDKMSKVRNWRTPRDYNDVQKFLGMVNYLANFMPNVSMYTGPLAEITRNGHSFEWRPLHQKCFDSIKNLACKVPILRPIIPASGETIWVICDASLHGVGALYGQGPNWEVCRPAGLMSKKFTTVQHAYRVAETETLAILEALLKWEDKLMGYSIHIISDHEALQFFKTQKLSPRQTRWMEYFERYSYDITYVEGIRNKVADVLSRYYESDLDGEMHTFDEYVSADIRLDPTGEDLPRAHLEEAQRMREQSEDVLRLEAKRITPRDDVEERTREAKELWEHREDPSPIIPEEAESPLPERISRYEGFIQAVKAGYPDDVVFAKVIDNVGHHAAFHMRDDLLFTKNRSDGEVLCIPRTMLGKQSLIHVVIDNAHSTIGHFGNRKTADYVRRCYWWPSLTKDVAAFCKTCGVCQTTKTLPLKPAGLLHSLPVPARPWSSISMDFIGPFPRSDEYDYVWVVLCRLTAEVHLTPVTTTVTASELAWIYVRDIVRLHGVADSIVSDRDSKFTSAFWKEVHRLLGTKLLMSTVFHPQTDGATERVNRSIGQVLRAMIQPDQRDWRRKLPMVEFALNSTSSSSTGFAPFELTRSYMPRMVQTVEHSELPGVRQFADAVLENLDAAHDAIIESRIVQTHHANRRRRDENMDAGDVRPIQEEDKVYLSTANLKIPKGRARKLVPKFIGPYTVLKANPETSNYTLDLPEDLRQRRMHPVFHVSRLRRHEPNDDE